MFRQIGRAVVLAALALHAGLASAEASQVVLNRDGSTIALEAYAPNIIRVTLSLLKEPTVGPPGFGFVAAPSATGWTRQHVEADVPADSVYLLFGINMFKVLVMLNTVPTNCIMLPILSKVSSEFPSRRFRSCL